MSERFEHRNGLSCSEIEDEADYSQGQLQELLRQRAQVHATVSRVHQWLIDALHLSTEQSRRALMQDAEAELRELLGLDSTDPA